MKGIVLFTISVVVFVAILLPQPSSAHRSGCHTLHSCASDSTTYLCGDLVYPCDGSTSLNDVELKDIVVPLLVEATFEPIFERVPSEGESSYWKKRLRSDKGSLTKIRRAMRWHKSTGSFGPPPVIAAPASIVAKINWLFRAAYDGRDPTGSENRYWLTRIDDKPTEQVMHGAMIWHRQNNIGH